MIHFRIYENDNLVYDPFLVNAGHNVLSPKLSLELNKSGSLTFTLPTDNECYNTIQKLSSIVRVYLDNVIIFKGRVMYDERDFYNRKQIYCEGALSFLMDSQMRPFDITSDVESFLGLVLANHNNYVDQDKWLELGTVTVLGSGTIEYNNTDYQSSLDVLTKNLLEKFAGYLRIREEYDDLQMQYVTYVDYLSAYEVASTQPIEFGKNLLDLKEHISAEEVFTVLIPLGAKQKDGEGDFTGRLTIESVNDGKDYLENQTGIELFGKIERTQVWDDITTPEALLQNAREMLNSGVNTATTITIKAVDLHMTDDTIAAFVLGDLVRVVSAPHALDTQFQITKIDYDITSPDQTVYTFSADFGAQPTGPAVAETGSGDEDEPIVDVTTGINPIDQPMVRRDGVRPLSDPEPLREETNIVSYYALDKHTKPSNSLTDKIVRQRKETEVVNTTIDREHNEVRNRVAQVINNGIGGYVYILPDEIYIMNTDSLDTATKVWRWNLGGLGYWSGAAGGASNPNNYTVAMTQDGEIVADFITAGTMNASRLTAGTITADLIKDASGVDWLTKLNTMLSYASSASSEMMIGQVRTHGYSNSITFGFGANNSGKYIRLYAAPEGWYDGYGVLQDIFILFHVSNSSIYGLDTGGNMHTLSQPLNP